MEPVNDAIQKEKKPKKKMGFKKAIGILCLIALLTIGAKILIDWTSPGWYVGMFWHLTHKSRINYEDIELTVPFGWFVEQTEKSLFIEKYHFFRADGSDSIQIMKGFTKKGLETSKKVAEGLGYYPRESKVFIGDKEAILVIWEGSEKSVYIEEIFIPSQYVLIAYWGLKKDADHFRKFLSTITFKGSKPMREGRRREGVGVKP